MSVRALLLDLDDTLLINDIESFFPAYYGALVERFKDVLPPVKLLDALKIGTKAMMANTGTGRINSKVFWHEFTPRVERPREEMEPIFQSFYENEFDALASVTSVDPAARRLVQIAREKGYALAVATQPVFPLPAVLARLRWAGVPHEEIQYDFISTYDDLSACKPHPAFFEQVLDALGVEPSEAVMVGDSLTSDMPASKLGIRTFWVTRNGGVASEADWSGDLNALCELVLSGGLDEE